MINNYLKTCLLLSMLVFPAVATADWPVAITDKVAFHPAQRTAFFDVISNDIGDGLEVTEVNQWSENGARLSTSGTSIVYDTPVGFNFEGEDGFWYVIEDRQGRTNSVRVSVDVKPRNSVIPAPQEDLVKTPKDRSIRIDVLDNDLFSTASTNPVTGAFFFDSTRGVITDFNAWSQKGGRIEKIEVNDGEPLGIFFVDPSLQFQLKYTPPKGFSGTDTFWYVIEDTRAEIRGTKPQPTKVTIHVSDNNKITTPYPIANPDKATLSCGIRDCNEGGVSFNVLENDSGNNLKLILNSGWSQKGREVKVIPRYPEQPVIVYIPDPANISEKDKVWYVIEDEFGRQTWSVLEIN